MNTKLINNYTPTLPASRWAPIAKVVREAVRAFDRTEVEAVRYALTVMARFADWVHMRAAATLDSSMLHPAVIDVYTQYRATEVSPVVAERERKMLRALAGLSSGPETRPVSTVSTPERPYTGKEQTQIRFWAEVQPSVSRIRSCAAIALLGMGCGLTTSEMLQVRARDLHPLSTGGLGVAVTGTRERFVPALAQWEDLHEHIAAADADEFVIAPGATYRERATLMGIMKSSLGDIRPTPQRMRATWLVGHLDAGTHLTALMHAAGLTSTDSLKRFLPYAAELPEQAFLLALRQAVTA